LETTEAVFVTWRHRYVRFHNNRKSPVLGCH